MSYDMVQRLAADPQFHQRVQSCLFQESIGRSADPDPASAWLANEQLKGNPGTTPTFVNMIAAFPGVADGATITLGDGSQMVDQTAVTDEDVLAQVQANWQKVADLFYVPPS